MINFLQTLFHLHHIFHRRKILFRIHREILQFRRLYENLSIFLSILIFPSFHRKEHQRHDYRHKFGDNDGHPDSVKLPYKGQK